MGDSNPPAPLPKEAYTVGVICALALEMQAVRALLDVEHKSLRVRPDDSNIYVLGSLSGHNIVIARSPGIQGKGAAAISATNLTRTFPRVKYHLMVGIGGGVPSRENDIRLGDVVISMPTANNGGVVQYDYAKETDDGFLLKGFLLTPPPVLRAAAYKMQHEDNGLCFSDVAHLLSKRPLGPDVLFQTEFLHPTGVQSCEHCGLAGAVQRVERQTDEPVVFYGLVASGDRVIKTARAREELNRFLGGDVLCFEMEAAGFMHEFPALVIRGISDYADSHKNDTWQPYAAGAAAWCLKAVLLNVEPERTFTADQSVDKQLFNEFVTDICESDPQNEMVRIQQSKGTLLDACCKWVIESTELQQWQTGRDPSLLWIKGGPGKGKTMTLIGLVQLLKNPECSESSISSLAYFFFQSNVPHLNNALSALRAILWKLFWEHPWLSKYIPNEYRCKGAQKGDIFESPNAFSILTSTLSRILHDESIGQPIIIIDAIDECQVGMDCLLDWIASETSTPESRGKWLLSSRPNIAMTECLRAIPGAQSLSLDDNRARVDIAVQYFIQDRVGQLAQRKALSEGLRRDIETTLKGKAEFTFLWVALVCQRLLRCSRRNIQKELEGIPAGLMPLYDQSLRQIEIHADSLDDTLYKPVLRSIVLAFRPLSIEEVVLAVGLDEVSTADILDLVELCGSFLTLRDNHIFLQHQSVSDYFCNGLGQRIFPCGVDSEHASLLDRLVRSMEAELRRDIYGLQDPGFSIDHITPPNPDPLLGIQYAATYWVEHLRQSLESVLPEAPTDVLAQNSSVQRFLRRHLLHWIEALSLMRQARQAPTVILSLQRTIETHYPDKQDFRSLVADAHQFILYNRPSINVTPLQIYYSGLTFSPQTSILRSMFKDDIPTWLKNPHNLDEQWSPCLHVLEGHTEAVVKVVFSPDMRFIISGSTDCTIRVWDAWTGACLRTLKGHEKWVSDLAVSPGSDCIASHGADQTVRLWNLRSGVLQVVLRTKDCIDSMAFTPDGQRLVLLSAAKYVHIWDISYNPVIRTYKLPVSMECKAMVSPNGRWIASMYDDGIVRVSDLVTGLVKLAVKPKYDITWINIICGDRDTLVVAGNWAVELWSLESGIRIAYFQPGADRVLAAHVLPDGSCVALSAYASIGLWDMGRDMILQTFVGHTETILDIAISANGQVVASASVDDTVRVWNAALVFATPKPRSSTQTLEHLAISPDDQQVASASDGHVKLWDLQTGFITQDIQQDTIVNSIEFSSDSKHIVVSTDGGGKRVWDCRTGEALQGITYNSVSPKTAPRASCSASFDEFPRAFWDNRDVPPDGIYYQHPWIMLNGHRVLRVPRTYQPYQFAATDTIAVIGCYTGQILILDFRTSPKCPATKRSEQSVSDSDSIKMC